MRVQEVWSGGQTGADQGGLRAARELGLKTGGWAPQGYRTETGRAGWLASYGLKEHPSPYYSERTAANVCDTDGTLLVGSLASPGSRATRRLARADSKPFLHVPWRGSHVEEVPAIVQEVRAWLETNSIEVLNVAGNRESRNRGVGDATRDLLILVLS